MLSPTVYIHPTAVVDAGAELGHGTKVWHFCHVMGGAVIGANCSLGQNVFVADGVRLGDNCKVQNNVSLYTGVICESDVFLGPSCVFTNVINPRSAVNRRGEYQVTHLHQGVSVGANATLICGITLGAYVFVAAGSVVTKSAPAFALLKGNPARITGWMSVFGEKLRFDADGYATCPGDGSRYYLEGGRVSRLVSGRS